MGWLQKEIFFLIKGIYTCNITIRNMYFKPVKPVLYVYNLKNIFAFKNL